jgi:tryptophan synthase alpha chain
MSFIKKYIGEINSKKEKVLSVFLTAGFPDKNSFIKTAKALLDSGADMFEIGIPFSDPLADGPIIQSSSKTALDNGTTVSDCLTWSEELSAYSSKPIILMGYGNPIKKYGISQFMNESAASGVRGLIVPDVPLEEYDSFFANAAEGPEIILLTTPSSTDERIKLIDAKSSGFVYCVSITGTTGVKETFTQENFENLKRTSTLISKNKMLIGFGISRPEDVKRFSPYCDGVIVGSAIIKTLMEPEGLNKTCKLVSELKNACVIRL